MANEPVPKTMVEIFHVLYVFRRIVILGLLVLATEELARHSARVDLMPPLDASSDGSRVPR